MWLIAAEKDDEEREVDERRRPLSTSAMFEMNKMDVAAVESGEQQNEDELQNGALNYNQRDVTRTRR